MSDNTVTEEARLSLLETMEAFPELKSRYEIISLENKTGEQLGLLRLKSFPKVAFFLYLNKSTAGGNRGSAGVISFHDSKNFIENEVSFVCFCCIGKYFSDTKDRIDFSGQVSKICKECGIEFLVGRFMSHWNKFFSEIDVEMVGIKGIEEKLFFFQTTKENMSKRSHCFYVSNEYARKSRRYKDYEMYHDEYAII